MRYWTRWCCAVLLLGCGEGNFVVSNESYEPRLVVEGLLQPGKRVERIRITRNFRLDANLRSLDLIPDDVRAKIIAEESGVEYPLSFHQSERFEDLYFEYTGDDLAIEHGKSYRLDVRATVEGRKLHTWTTTTVPEAGFRIAGVNYEQLPYRPLDEGDEPINFQVQIERSPSSRLYLMTVSSLDGSSANFVYDNPFTEQKPREVEDDLDDFTYSWDWIQNTPREPGISTIEIFWFFLWFYGEYEVVVYATDLNYQHYLQTFPDVREEDGNFHEPQFELEGDGIGYFGSVVEDRVRIEVVGP